MTKENNLKFDKYRKSINSILLVLSILTVVFIALAAPFGVERFFQKKYINKDVYVKEKGLRRETFSNNYLKESDNLLNNKILIPSKDNNYWQYNGDMNEFKNQNRSDQRYLYSFFMLNDLVNAYNQTENVEYLKKGFAYLKDFYEQCPYDFDPVGNMPWHDESTAQRQINTVRFYKVAKYYLAEDELKLMRDNLEFTANKLNSEMYTGFNNHGMFQDLSLYFYGKAFAKPSLVSESTTRLQEYFLKSFSSEGVHLENSPEYHFEMLYILKDFFNSVQSTDFDKYDELLDVYKKSVRYSKMVILPNGYLPNIGDTASLKIDLSDFYSKEDLKYSHEGRNAFLDSGFDIYKKDKSYLAFIGPAYLSYHHHDHDLSFWLYKNGNIFTEVGKYGYDWDNPESKYVRTYPAHNSVVIDGEEEISPSILDGEMLNLGDNKMAAISRRSEKAEVYREIDFDDELTKINVKTSILPKDDKEKTYELYFHLAPEIKAMLSKDKKSVELFRADESIGSVHCEEEMELKKDKFYSRAYDKGQKTQVIYIKTSGLEKHIDFEINLK